MIDTLTPYPTQHEKFKHDCCNSDDLLGFGNYCEVYGGKFNGRKVAIKILRSDKISFRHQLAFCLPKFENEASCLEKIGCHKNIIRVIRQIKSDEGRLLALYLERCSSLMRHLANNPILTIPSLIPFARSLYEALQFLHERGISHNDIKSDNLMIGQDGELKIIDFNESRESKEISSCGYDIYNSGLCLRSMRSFRMEASSEKLLEEFIAFTQLPEDQRPTALIMLRKLESFAQTHST